MSKIGKRFAADFVTAGPGHRFARRLGAALILVAILPAASPVATLDVSVTKLRSDKGMLRVCLTADPANFPGCTDDKDAITRSVDATTHLIRFEGMAPGSYALSIIHDENSNAKLDTLVGIPREGFGFSRNPVILFGPPRFAAARFAIGEGDSVQQVQMRYLL